MDDIKMLNHDSGSVENVALKLLEKIAYYETTPSPTEARHHMLKLYSDCLAAVKGFNV